MVKDIKLWFKTLELGNSIPKSRLQVYMRYMVFIRFNIKKYNFIKEDKDIFNFIKCEKKVKRASG